MNGPNAERIEDSYFGDGKNSYRSLPNYNFILAFLKRNAIIIATAGTLFSPFVLIKILMTSTTYESSVYLRYDPLDSLQFEGRITDSLEFPETAQFFNRELDDLKFLEDLASRYRNKEIESFMFIVLKFFGLEDSIKWFVEPQKKKLDLQKAGKLLRSKINFFPDVGIRGSTIMRISTLGTSLEDAQKLGVSTANLLIERFYAKELAKIQISIRSLNDFLENETVKKVVEDAKIALKDRGTSNMSPSNSLDQLREIKARQATAQARMKEINEQIRANISRRNRLEASLAEVSQRYGPFHPERRALEAEITELRSKDGMNSLSNELKNLEQKLLEAEADAAAVSGEDEQEERADRTVQRIYTKLDRFKLEEQKISEQIAKPHQRTRLYILGDPTTPAQPPASGRQKIAVLGAAIGLIFGILIAIFREIRRPFLSEEWTIRWLLNTPCLLKVKNKSFTSLPTPDKKTVHELKQKVLTSRQRNHELITFQDLREFALNIRKESKGSICVFIPASKTECSMALIDHIISIYAKDNAGKFLMIDFGSSSETLESSSAHQMATLLDVILQRVPIESAFNSSSPYRLVDKISSNDALQARISEVVTSTKFSEFIASSRRIYNKIFIRGLGPEYLVENASILEKASEYYLVVDGSNANRSTLDNIKKKLPDKKMQGFILIE